MSLHSLLCYSRAGCYLLLYKTRVSCPLGSFTHTTDCCRLTFSSVWRPQGDTFLLSLYRTIDQKEDVSFTGQARGLLGFDLLRILLQVFLRRFPEIEPLSCSLFQKHTALLIYILPGKGRRVYVREVRCVKGVRRGTNSFSILSSRSPCWSVEREQARSRSEVCLFLFSVGQDIPPLTFV